MSAHNSAKTQFLETNGVRYAYRRFGSGNTPRSYACSISEEDSTNWDPAVTTDWRKAVRSSS